MHPDAVEIRPAGPADADPIAELHADSWRRTYRGMMRDDYLDGDLVGERRALWRGRLTDPPPDLRAWTATADGALLGFVCLFADEDPHWGCYVDNLHVRLEARGRRIGLALLRHAAAWTLAERPGAGLWLWVMEANHAARGFYRRAGAAEAERVISGNPVEDSSPIVRCTWPDPSLLLTGGREGELWL